MKAVILAGGLGTRLSEETHLKPKPMVEVGGKPILWHILKIYSHFGINEFVICCGYKGYLIKEYFANYFLHTSDVTFHMDVDNYMEVHHKKSEPWKVTLVDTGEMSQTGGRLGRVRDYLGDDCFCFTYGDGVSNVDISSLIALHKEGREATSLRAASWALWSIALGRRFSKSISGKARWRQRMDQRWLFCTAAERLGSDYGRWN